MSIQAGFQWISSSFVFCSIAVCLWILLAPRLTVWCFSNWIINKCQTQSREHELTHATCLLLLFERIFFFFIFLPLSCLMRGELKKNTYHITIFFLSFFLFFLFFLSFSSFFFFLFSFSFFSFLLLLSFYFHKSEIEINKYCILY